MGWKGTYRNREQAVTEELSGYAIHARHEGRRGTWVVGEYNGRKGIAIVLFENGMAKVVDETMGPVDIDCPLSFFDLAPCPEPCSYAEKWRERVKAARRVAA